MNPELVEAIRQATAAGVIPNPAPGEPMGSYKLRAATAGAAATLAFLTEQARAADVPNSPPPAPQPGDVGTTSDMVGRPSDVMVTSPAMGNPAEEDWPDETVD